MKATIAAPCPESDVAQSESSPRRLLRDVGSDKLLVSIMAGTLEPGERLNDEELVGWLGVSRTPIREAIAALSAWGLVDLEANRNTKVAAQDAATFKEASRFLPRLHDFAASWEGRRATADLKKRLSSAAKKIAGRDVTGTFDLLEAYGELVASTGNALFIATELPLRTRVKFLSPREVDAYDWDAVEQRVRTLEGVLG